jgi:hypothetical protein
VGAEGMIGLTEGVTFKKTGAEIKAAVQTRIRDLEQRLKNRNAVLEELLNDKKRLRSYLVRDPDNPWPRVGVQFQYDIPSEDHQEITELCRRVFVLEKELSNLRMILGHLRDDQEFDLTFEQMMTYGFKQESV